MISMTTSIWMCFKGTATAHLVSSAIEIKSPNSAKIAPKIYIKRQGTDDFGFAPSNNFGSLWNGPGIKPEFIHIMVNGYLIIGDKILPNTVQRINFGLGNDLQTVDTNGGLFYSQVPGIMMFISRTALVYLPPGTWAFSIGARSGLSYGTVRGGIATYKLTELENEDLGDLALARFPNKDKSEGENEYESAIYGLWRTWVYAQDNQTCPIESCAQQIDNDAFCNKILSARAFLILACIFSCMSGTLWILYCAVRGDTTPRALLLLNKCLVFASLLTGIVGVAVGINATLTVETDIELRLGPAAIIGIVGICVNLIGAILIIFAEY
ncbi:unnamed protein product [Rotaria magnacalcarata]